MHITLSRKSAVGVVAAAVLVGGGLSAVAPAVAGEQASYAATTSWKKVWKKKLAPLADKRYYTRAQADGKYATKAETAAGLGNVYTKAQSDGAFQPKGSYAPAGSSYTKAESDARHAPYPALIRGTYFNSVSNGATVVLAPVQFGVTLSETPTTHYINAGAVVPAGCSGTSAAPNAAPGHLCVFETASGNLNARNVMDNNGTPGAFTAFGGSVFGYVAAGGPSFLRGSWAVRPLGLAAAAAGASGGINHAVNPDSAIN